MTEYIWPEIFVDPDACERPAERAREAAVAMALHGWGLCCAGAKMPKAFGRGMVKLGQWAGETLTPDNVDRLADEILGEKTCTS